MGRLVRHKRYTAMGNLDALPVDWQPSHTGAFLVTWSIDGVVIDTTWVYRDGLKPLVDYLVKEGYDHVVEYHQRATIDFNTVARVVADL